jgi:excisionase family DNA binding protein
MSHASTHARSQPRNAAASPSLLTIDECAELARCSRRTIHEWIAKDLFASVRPVARGSSRRLVEREVFLRFLGLGPVA